MWECPSRSRAGLWRGIRPRDDNISRARVLMQDELLDAFGNPVPPPSEPLTLLALPAELLKEVIDHLEPLDTLRFAASCTAARAHGLSASVWARRLAVLLQGRWCLSAKHTVERPLRAGGPYPGGPSWSACNTPANINFFQTSAFAFFDAIHDATRTAITRHELSSCKAFGFRFKQQAGEMWTAADPWWNGQPPIQLRLCADDTVRPVNDAMPFWGPAGQPVGTWCFEPGHWASRSVPPSQRLRPDQPAVVTMNGHPSYTVRRHPKHWGVFLESCWCVWTAFPMAPRGADPLMEDEALRVSTKDPRQLREVENYNALVGRT